MQAKASPHAEPLASASPAFVNAESHEAEQKLDGNPYELELERLLKKQQRQAEKMAKMGRCLECGKKLGIFAKMWGLKFCKEHGF